MTQVPPEFVDDLTALYESVKNLYKENVDIDDIQHVYGILACLENQIDDVVETVAPKNVEDHDYFFDQMETEGRKYEEALKTLREATIGLVNGTSVSSFEAAANKLLRTVSEMSFFSPVEVSYLIRAMHLGIDDAKKIKQKKNRKPRKDQGSN